MQIYLERFEDKDGEYHYVDTKYMFQFLREHPDFKGPIGVIVEVVKVYE